MFNKITPRNLFLIDSLGALFSAFMLGFLLVKLEHIIGMPSKVLYYLSFIAFIFFIYSLMNYLVFPVNWTRYMKIIAIFNLTYCLLTMSLVIMLYSKLTLLGLVYFTLEIMIICILAVLEFKTASTIQSPLNNK